MGEAATGPPFQKQTFLTDKLFITAAGIGIGFNKGPHRFFLFPTQFVIHQGLDVEIRYRMPGRRFHYLSLKYKYDKAI